MFKDNQTILIYYNNIVSGSVSSSRHVDYHLEDKQTKLSRLCFKPKNSKYQFSL